ncbi:MAG: nucleotide sugar epimerase [Chloroflexi bacterium]|nr:MAG: nucleotide sugar epimerase [Chloroflexota bacterium]
MRVLVTGAAGFVGSHVCDALLSAGHEVVGLDSFIPYYPRATKEANLRNALAHPAFTFHELDLRSDYIGAALDGVDAVIHQAAMPGLMPSWTRFDDYMTCNLQATQRLVEAARIAGIRKFLHISTSSVYGSTAVGDENQPVAPVSPYGVTKLAAEQLILAWVRSYGFPATILRYFSIYGPRQRPDMAYSVFIDALINDRPITIYGDGEQTRSNTEVSDCVRGTLMALEAGLPGEIYNIGGGRVISINRAVAVLADALGATPRIEYAPARLGDQRHTRADTRKAQQAFGYEPTIDPEEGLVNQAHWQSRVRVTTRLHLADKREPAQLPAIRPIHRRSGS